MIDNNSNKKVCVCGCGKIAAINHNFAVGHRKPWKHFPKSCEYCGKETMNKHFCSNKCHAKWGVENKSGQFIFKGRKPWNTGLTKEIDNRVEKAAIKRSNTTKTKYASGEIKNWNDGLTKKTDKRVAVAANKISKSLIGNKRGLGRPCSSGIGRGKTGIREDIGHYVRSTWEANIARVFLLNNISYEYEKHRFILGDCSYCPDFYIPEKDIYIEVKGYLTSKAKEVLRKFIKANPDIALLVIDKEVYKTLQERFKDKIIVWE